MKKLRTWLTIGLLFALGTLAGLAGAQTQTTYTGVIRDLAQNPVTSGQVTFTLAPPTDSTVPGVGRFTPSTVPCNINGDGSLSGYVAGVVSGACSVTKNTALSPGGTSYRVCIQPNFATPGSCFYDYATTDSKDISTIAPTLSTGPVNYSGIPGPVGPAGCTSAPCSGDFNPTSLNGFEVHFQRYAGATADVQLASARTAWAGSTTPLVYVSDAFSTWSGPSTLGNFERLILHAGAVLTTTSARMTLTGNNRVTCIPGVSISGPSNGAAGYVFLYANSGANYDLLQDCTVHDMERGVLMPKGVANVKIHDVTDAYNLYSLAFLGIQATTTGFNADQPTNIRYYSNNVRNSVLGLDLYYSHNVKAWANTCTDLSLYCLTGAGGNAAGDTGPNGSNSDYDYHGNICLRIQACEFLVMADSFSIGKGSAAHYIGDLGFDCEGCSNGSVSGHGDHAANGIAASYFKSWNVTFDDVISPDSPILIRNVSGSPAFVSNFKILNSTVAGALVEASIDLEVANSTFSKPFTMLQHARANVHNTTVQTTMTTAGCAFCIGAPYFRQMDQFTNNTATLVGSAPSGSVAFQIGGAYGDDLMQATFTGNRNNGFPVWFKGIAATPGYWHLDFNHHDVGITTPTSGNSNVSESAYFDNGDNFTVLRSGAATTTGTGSFLCQDGAGNIFAKATACQ